MDGLGRAIQGGSGQRLNIDVCGPHLAQHSQLFAPRERSDGGDPLVDAAPLLLKVPVVMLHPLRLLPDKEGYPVRDFRALPLLDIAQRLTWFKKALVQCLKPEFL